MATTTTRMKFVSDRKRREKGGASYLLCVYVCFVLVVTAGTRQPELTPLTSALHRGISSHNTRKCVWSV